MIGKAFVVPDSGFYERKGRGLCESVGCFFVGRHFYGEQGMDAVVVTVFSVVYLGMIAGRFPGLALDRTGIALLGAIALVGFGKVSVADAWRAIDAPTIILLFGLMVVSAQLRISGGYSWITRSLALARVSQPAFLALVMGTSAALSALLANDIICLAMAPILVHVSSARRANPVPLLLGLACASNIGSAATLIGNPQNILIGQVLDIPFAGYMGAAFPVVLVSMTAAWAIIVFLYRGRWAGDSVVPEVEAPTFDAWQTLKGACIVLLLMACFLSGFGEREVWALVAAGFILASRTVTSRNILSLVDWQLLILFSGLFVVNHALAASGATAQAMNTFARAGVDLSGGGSLFVAVAVLSNIVSNVPAVMLLLPGVTSAHAGTLLALASTLAGNFLIVGSIANIIVSDQAGRLGVRLCWREHAKTGIPVTLVSLCVAWAFLR